MNQHLKKYLEAVSQEREDEFAEVLARLDWLGRRITDLENALPLYRLEDPAERNGVARKLSELRNTISQAIYPRARANGFEKLLALTGPGPLPAGGRIFIDVTTTVGAPFVTGIQRVVLEFARRAGAYGGVPIHLGPDGPMACDPDGRPSRVEFRAGDIFLMLDLPLDYLPAAESALTAARRAGAYVVAVVYDLIPILFPETASPAIVRMFRRWFEACALACDGLICISNAVADDVRAHLEKRSPGVRGRATPWVTWAHLGCDFTIANAPPTSLVEPIIAAEAPFFLSVSTIEPRKGHAIVLDAMERLWASGSNARLVIVGRYGWGRESLRRRIFSHPAFGERLLWLERCSDADLAHLYRNARALIYASLSEGFGLPILEAAHFGLPSIVSDIPVFHEIAGNGAVFFQAADGDALFDRLEGALGSQKRSPAVRALTWDEAAERFYDEVRKRVRVRSPGHEAARDNADSSAVVREVRAASG